MIAPVDSVGVNKKKMFKVKMIITKDNLVTFD